MTTPRRPGRPPSDNPRRKVIRYRLTADELAQVEAAAAKAGQTATEWARDVTLRAASDAEASA